MAVIESRSGWLQTPALSPTIRANRKIFLSLPRFVWWGSSQGPYWEVRCWKVNLQLSLRTKDLWISFSSSKNLHLLTQLPLSPPWPDAACYHLYRWYWTNDEQCLGSSKHAAFLKPENESQKHSIFVSFGPKDLVSHSQRVLKVLSKVFSWEEAPVWTFWH